MLNVKFCVGMYLPNDDAVCSYCMSEEDYRNAETIISSFDEMDYRCYCTKCNEAIDHSLTSDGWAYESSLREEQAY